MVPCTWSLTGAHLELVHMQRLPRLRSSGEWDHTPLYTRGTPHGRYSHRQTDAVTSNPPGAGPAVWLR